MNSPVVAHTVASHMAVARHKYREALRTGTSPQQVISKIRLEFARAVYYGRVARTADARDKLEGRARGLHSYLLQREYGSVHFNENFSSFVDRTAATLAIAPSDYDCHTEASQHRRSREQLMELVFGPKRGQTISMLSLR